MGEYEHDGKVYPSYREFRMHRNRESAAKSRQVKRDYIASLERQVDELLGVVEVLRAQNCTCRAPRQRCWRTRSVPSGRGWGRPCVLVLLIKQENHTHSVRPREVAQATPLPVVLGKRRAPPRGLLVRGQRQRPRGRARAVVERQAEAEQGDRQREHRGIGGATLRPTEQTARLGYQRLRRILCSYSSE